MDLTDWQRRLEAHFAELRRERSATVGDRPIFVLEHGLNGSDLENLEALVRGHVASACPFGQHWLPWIVYAAELGYRYSGEEYWQTFEAETPGWLRYGDRSWIRLQFINFHKKFGGAKPSGPWAEWFSIICWPITHAILPKDLQRQLARILYEVRHSFCADLFDSPMDLGELVAAHSYEASSRFQKFAQEPLLVGQIAAALLIEDSLRTKTLILPSTLRRIAEDLERERQARAWMFDARKSAARITLHGLGRLRSSAAPDRGGMGDQVRAHVTKLALEPRLFLKPAPERCLELWLELPDFSPLLIKFPSLHPILSGSRCFVAGSSGRPIWHGRILRGSQPVRLDEWPQGTQPLVRFERSNAELDYLLSTDCLLRPHNRWLFRTNSDGLAYESRNNIVRAGHRYFLLATSPIQEAAEGVTGVKLLCKNIYGIQLNVPSSVSESSLQLLRRLGLRLASTVEFWPVGLCAKSWDGEGNAEWLTSDCPCLAIRANHPLEELTLTVDENYSNRLRLREVNHGEVIFIDLSDLVAGIHRLQADTVSLPDRERDTGYLEIILREPQAWRPGMTSRAAMIIMLDPTTPSLEQLWEGSVDVEIAGPDGWDVKCTASFYDGRTVGSFFRKSLPRLTLPVTSDKWRKAWEQALWSSKEAHRSYDLAKHCRLDFASDELGTFSLIAEREFTPLRWVFGRSSGARTLTLIDDRGAQTTPEVRWYSFQKPDVFINMNTAQLSFIVPDEGGLYHARSADYERAVIVPPVVHSLLDLRTIPQITHNDYSKKGIAHLLSHVWTWYGARLTGDLMAAMRRRDVISALLEYLFGILGGDVWRRTECRIRMRADAHGLEDLKNAITNKPQERGLGTELMLDQDLLSKASLADRVIYFDELIHRYFDRSQGHHYRHDIEHRWLCEFALRLASGTDTTSKWSGSLVDEGVSALLSFPVLARAARFCVLLVDCGLPSRPVTGGSIYNGWEWQ